MIIAFKESALSRSKYSRASLVAALASLVAVASLGHASDGALRKADVTTHPAHEDSNDNGIARADSTKLQASQRPAHERTTPITLPSIEVRGCAIKAADKAEQRLTPGAVSVVNGDEFQQRVVSNMAGALRYVPGVFTQSNTGGDDGVISIRGSNLTALSYANSGVTLFQDGLPVTSADGANHNRLMDPLTASDVIVANGSNALTYGASDLGGAIDLISHTARNSDPRQLYLLGGSHDLFDGRASTGGVSGNFDDMVTLSAKHLSGYQQHSREQRASLDGNAGWQVTDDLGLRLFATYIDNRQQLAGSLTRAEFDANPRQADPSYVLGNHQLNVKTSRLATKGVWNINARSWLEFGVSYEVQSLYHPIVDTFDFSTSPPTDFFSLLINTTQRTAGGVVRYHLESDDHNVVAGVNLARTRNVGGNYENDHGRRGTKTDDIDQRAGNQTMFALDRWKFAPRWTFVYGAQGVLTDRDVRDVSLAYDHVRDQRHTYASLNPRLGLIYALSQDSEAFANVSRVYEAPNNFDLANDVRKDDSTLSAMQGISHEIGTRGRGVLTAGKGTWHWSILLFAARIRNEILSVEDPTQPGNMLATNYARTTHAGAEGLFGASFPFGGTAWRIEPLLSASWNDFSFDHDPVFGDNRLPMAPRYMLRGQIALRNSATGLYVGPTFDLAGFRYADMANRYRVGGHGLLGLRAGIRRCAWNLFVEARNLSDRNYVNTVTVLTRADSDTRVLNAGEPRSLFVGLKVLY